MSADMLNIAKRNNPRCEFVEGDMRSFDLQKKADAAIITGRTISYLVPDKDVIAAFKSINKNLNTAGYYLF